MLLDYDPISNLLWAAGQILIGACGNTLLFFPFTFVALWLLKRLAMLIFPAPKSLD